MFRTLSSLSSSSAAAPQFARRFSVFASEGPSATFARLMKDRDAIVQNALDQGIPLGAPKPSMLNKLRESGRTPGAQERRLDSAEAKLRKAQDYKAARLEAEEKKKAAEAAAANNTQK